MRIRYLGWFLLLVCFVTVHRAGAQCTGNKANIRIDCTNTVEPAEYAEACKGSQEVCIVTFINDNCYGLNVESVTLTATYADTTQVGVPLPPAFTLPTAVPPADRHEFVFFVNVPPTSTGEIEVLSAFKLSWLVGPQVGKRWSASSSVNFLVDADCACAAPY